MASLCVTESRSRGRPRRSQSRITNQLITNYREHVSPGGFGSFECAGWQLDRRKRSQRSGNPPRRNALARLEHPPIPIDEDEVDWKPHEESVDRAAWRDDQRIARWQRVVLEQAGASAVRIEGRENAVGEHETSARVLNRAPARVAKERREECRHVGNSLRRPRRRPYHL